MTEFTISIAGDDQVRQGLRSLTPRLANFVIAPALGAMARVVWKLARQRGYGFQDATGTSDVRLRSTLRLRRISAYYGEGNERRRYRRGRAAVIAGGRGARQSYLVERGHRGPRPARPHPFLGRSLLDTQQQQFAAFVGKARERFSMAVVTAARDGRSRGASFGRTLSRRARAR